MAVRSSGAFERRAAENIARVIELDIIARDLPVGALIGSEADLMKRFDASRGVVREAVTLIESHMLAKTRRGTGGGLIVTEPVPSVVEGIVSLYLARKKASEAELLEARLPLEMLAMRRTLEYLDDDGVALLEREREHRLGADEDLTFASHRFHNLVAELSRNTVLQLFVPTMCALVGELWDAPRREMSAATRAVTWAGVAGTHNAIIDAMLRRDLELSLSLLEAHLAQVSDALRPEARLVQVLRH